MSEQIQTGTCAWAARLLTRWAHNERGATSVEYALVASSIFLLVVGSLYAFGGDMSKMFGTVSSTANAVLK